MPVDRIAMTRPKDNSSDLPKLLTRVDIKDWPQLDVSQQTAIILDLLCHFLTRERAAQLGVWFEHVGFDISALSQPYELRAAWLGHYRHGRGYDVDRAINDYLSWTSIEKQATSPFPNPHHDGNSRKKSSNGFGKSCK